MPRFVMAMSCFVGLSLPLAASELPADRAPSCEEQLELGRSEICLIVASHKRSFCETFYNQGPSLCCLENGTKPVCVSGATSTEMQARCEQAMAGKLTDESDCARAYVSFLSAFLPGMSCP